MAESGRDWKKKQRIDSRPRENPSHFSPFPSLPLPRGDEGERETMAVSACATEEEVDAGEYLSPESRAAFGQRAALSSGACPRR